MEYTFIQETIDRLERANKEARGSILKMTTLAKSGHPGGSMSTIDLLMSVYEIANINPENIKDENRDIVVVSNGHISPAVYSALAYKQFFQIEDAISQFRLAGSIFEGHIERTVPGVEWGTGNLGQGLSAACGFALASKLKGIANHVYVFMGDGEQQKGQISEARRFAVKFGLNNLTVIIDYNKLQISGDIAVVMPQDIRDNFLSDGWEVVEIDGHNFTEISNALYDAKDNETPVMILANTIMGKGISFMENKAGFHGAPLNNDQLVQAIQELGLDDNFKDMIKLREIFKASSHPIVNNFQPDLLEGQYRVYEKATDNRSAWGNALVDLENSNKHSKTPLVVFDCDLAGSVKTSDFAKTAPERFIQSGIMEHNTSVVSGVLSTCNFQTFWADFGVFGIDEVYNMHRLTDINHGNLNVVVTHVGLDVGEDGKTHQCIDYIGAMRNIFGFKVIVPADPNQTDRAVRYMATEAGNKVIAMGRSKLAPITNEEGQVFFNQNYKFEYGKADKFRDGDEAALLVTGTLANTAVNVADSLRKKGINLQVWNISSPLLIDEQALTQAAKTGLIFTLEDHNANSGLGLSVAEALVDKQLQAKLVKFGVKSYALSGSSEDVFKLCGLDEENIERQILDEIK
ncbi:transketolase [bacterium]|nr:transketolase [bacterium]